MAIGMFASSADANVDEEIEDDLQGWCEINKKVSQPKLKKMSRERLGVKDDDKFSFKVLVEEDDREDDGDEEKE